MSKNAKLTPWFSTKERPARVGLYEAAYDWVAHRPPAYRWWNGREWKASELGGSTLFGLIHRDKWRGITKEPK